MRTVATQLHERNKQLIEFVTTSDEHGIYPALKIAGKRFGITRERVRQILKAHNITKTRFRRWRGRCIRDGCLNERTVANRLHCTRHTHAGKWAERVTLMCHVCGKQFQRRNNIVDSKQNQEF
ncbi:hypothetical protein IH879_20830, partial [candidate division KSB1 bacterium]|nr:hypothetical protein [candidate division KSB1 bacterium]